MPSKSPERMRVGGQVDAAEGPLQDARCEGCQVSCEGSDVMCMYQVGRCEVEQNRKGMFC